jgi:guanosine-3',5'-bis(diphosphate) 3'-pyrophosphohydrolase
MVGPQHTGENSGFPEGTQEILGIKTEVTQRLVAASDFDPAHLDIVEGLSNEYWHELIDTIEDPDSLDNITGDNWAASHAEQGTEAALMRVASVKALPPDEDIKKYKHGVSIENSMKLALEAAGDMPSLRIFGEVLRAKLIAGKPDRLAAQQALLVWAPVAEIAGWHELRTELEEAGFAALYPKERQEIEDTYAHLGGDEAAKKLVEEYGEGVEVIAKEYLDLDVKLQVKGRKKGYYSVWRKVTKDGRPSYQLPDFVGMRVIIDVDSDRGEEKAIESCYAVADIVSQCFTPEIDRHKDYIANPKANGYQSLHLTVTDINDARVEFQVRTRAMHDKAEFDPNASHMIYAAAGKITPGRYFSKKMPKPERMYGWRDVAAAEIRRRREAGDDSLTDLEPSKVLVLSDDGNIYQLNERETALDFAFAVHNRRALSTQAIADKEGRQISLDSPLEFADVVTLKYHPDKAKLTWGDSWFTKVNSRVAQKALRKAQRERGEEGYIANGIRVLARELGRKGMQGSIVASLDEEHRAAIAEKYGINSFEKVLRSIGSRALAPGKVVSYLERVAGITHERKKPSKKTGGSAEQVYTDSEGQDWEIAVLGTLKCHHHFAGCCSIETGKDIVAVPSRRTGDFSIHNPGCVNLPEDGRKILESTWHMVSV